MALLAWPELCITLELVSEWGRTNDKTNYSDVVALLHSAAHSSWVLQPLILVRAQTYINKKMWVYFIHINHTFKNSSLQLPHTCAVCNADGLVIQSQAVMRLMLYLSFGSRCSIRLRVEQDLCTQTWPVH